MLFHPQTTIELDDVSFHSFHSFDVSIHVKKKRKKKKKRKTKRKKRKGNGHVLIQ